ncbi:MAG: DUF2493 domain-containing protein [Deltaproteobacteria bacterium]|jgi:hypothetical protein|nr:DUF2493 domain-containing protein [Deltaproteobacteria bacterium]
MKLCVFGSRNITDPVEVDKAIEDSKIKDQITEIVSGRAKGVDTLGEEYAARHGLPVKLFPPDYKKYGRPAPFRRNEAMAAYADYGVAIWDGVSHGTKHMIDLMKGRCHVHIVPQNEAPKT